MKRPLPTLLLALAAVALMAPRPSVGNLDARVDQLEAEAQADRDANCLKANADGDSYRPAYCDPGRCTVEPSPFVLLSSDTCTDTASGFHVEGAVSFSAVDCQLLPTSSFPECLYPARDGGFCTSDSDCPSGTVCDGNLALCTSGESCVAASTCSALVVPGILYECTGIGPAGSLTVAECGQAEARGDLVRPESINSRDALSCRDSVEALVGPCQ